MYESSSYTAASLSLPVSLYSQPSTLSKWIDLKNWDLHPSNVLNEREWKLSQEAGLTKLLGYSHSHVDGNDLK